MKKLLTFILVIVGLYLLLDWAATHPESIQQIHQKIEVNLNLILDKCQRAINELSK